MNNISYWRKKLLCSKYQLYSDLGYAGKMQDVGTCYSALAQFEETRYKFKVKGLLQQKAEVQDLVDGSAAGEIKFNCWWPGARIRIGDQYWDWRFTDWFFHAFLMTNDHEKIYFESDRRGGEVFGNTQNNLAIMSGLFVLNYYRQMLIICIVSIFPLLLLSLI